MGFAIGPLRKTHEPITDLAAKGKEDRDHDIFLLLAGTVAISSCASCGPYSN